jgi:mannose/fructose/N-acetylgalactosamine-specific phosphotransferase system component IIC
MLLSPAEQAYGLEMSTRNPVAWWNWTRIAAAVTFGVLLAAIIIAPLAWQAGGSVTLFSIPIAEFGLVIVLPFVLSFLVRRAWLVQDHIDRTFSVWEDQ